MERGRTNIEGVGGRFGLSGILEVEISGNLTVGLCMSWLMVLGILYGYPLNAASPCGPVVSGAWVFMRV